MEDKEIQLEESQLLIDAKSRTIVIKLYEKDGERNLALTGSPELMAAAGMEVAGIELPLIMPHDTMLEIGRALGRAVQRCASTTWWMASCAPACTCSPPRVRSARWK